MRRDEIERDRIHTAPHPTPTLTHPHPHPHPPTPTATLAFMKSSDPLEKWPPSSSIRIIDHLLFENRSVGEV
jgi:hypothetical protein